VFDERRKGPDELMEFRAGVGEDPETVCERILDLFANVKRRYSDVFDNSDALELDAESITYVVGELQPYCIVEAERDAIGDAFEVFMGPALRGVVIEILRQIEGRVEEKCYWVDMTEAPRRDSYQRASSTRFQSPSLS
jgi:hypothetical protein